MITKEEFEIIANKILSTRFCSGRNIVAVRINEHNLVELIRHKTSSVMEDWSGQDVREYCKNLLEIQTAYETLSLVWKFLGDKMK